MAACLKDATVRLYTPHNGTLAMITTLRELDFIPRHAGFFGKNCNLIVTNWNEKIRKFGIEEFDLEGKFIRKICQPQLQIWSWFLYENTFIIFDNNMNTLEIFNIIE